MGTRAESRRASYELAATAEACHREL
jgi:hypothetical protein